MKTIALTINGRSVSCPAGSSILDAALDAGIVIPALCHHPDLKAFGTCRLCLVEDLKTLSVLDLDKVCRRTTMPGASLLCPPLTDAARTAGTPAP